ncbi:MAG: hypothetical protein E6J90_48845 [Deltaproteobacteria bacterium]|nr:MAG: hypothetical protein E6J91_45460 [Deltaproteobacteria bacterium]TMQ05521.1 MAG: hypothetical protein E6J90_48845 [Deltaproteobacteria bacterium]
MHARGWVIGVVVAGAVVSGAAADPAPKPVDIKELKAKAVVLQDAQGGTYVVFRTDDPKVFYGPNAKTVYEQVIIGSSSDGEGRWEFNTWAPRVPEGSHLGSLEHKKDGSYQKTCRGKDDAGLTELGGAKAQAILDKTAFVTMGIIRVPHLLARDDSGVYYYVDRLAKIYGGKGYRVFVGRKGAMKQMPLTDVASDSAGDVFSTKSGDLRLVRNSENNKETMTWVKGGKRTELVFLDTDINSVVIFKDLGIYTFLGTLCDNV